MKRDREWPRGRAESGEEGDQCFFYYSLQFMDSCDDENRGAMGLDMEGREKLKKAG